MKTLLKYIPAVLILALVVLYANKKEQCPTKIEKKIYIPMNIAGVCNAKYIDDTNRGLLSIKVKQIDTVYLYPFDPNLDYSFYNDLKVGDSVYKEKGSLNFRIVNSEGEKFYTSSCP